MNDLNDHESAAVRSAIERDLLAQYQQHRATVNGYGPGPTLHIRQAAHLLAALDKLGGPTGYAPAAITRIRRSVASYRARALLPEVSA